MRTIERRIKAIEDRIRKPERQVVMWRDYGTMSEDEWLSAYGDA
jgi:hypothetical protein